MATTAETQWLEDANGNRCSVAYFGSVEAAQKALDSLKGCRDCTNCSDCSYCSGCSDCSDCSGCSGCSGCSDCSYCSDCSRCSGCSGCSYCEGRKGVEGDTKPPPVPVIPDIHAKVYEAVSQPKALDMSAWHTCETTHCRAGWVVAQAGEEGKALEAYHNTDLAARLIYEASGYRISPVRFHDSNEAAMEDMRRLALGPVASA